MADESDKTPERDPRKAKRKAKSRKPATKGERRIAPIELPSSITATLKAAASPKRMGRPSEYTPEAGSRLIALMSGAEDGTAHSLTAAAAYMGYARSTLEAWAKKHPDFSADLTRAKGLRLFRLEAELLHAQHSSQVTARMFVLRGESPEEYSETYKIKHAAGVDEVDPITKMMAELGARVLRPVELPPPTPAIEHVECQDVTTQQQDDQPPPRPIGGA